MPRSVSRIFLPPASRAFSATRPISCGRKELAFFQVHNFSGGDGGFDQIRLTAEKRGDLQDVHDFAGQRGLFLVVNIRQNRHAEFRADGGERFQPASMPGPRKDLPDVRLALSKLALKT